MLPFDKIKIDRSFVQCIDSDPEALKIVCAILSLALSLDLPVIAKGVANAGVAAELRDFGCSEGQGFHLGYPVSGEQMSRELAKSGTARWSRSFSARGPVSSSHLKLAV